MTQYLNPFSGRQFLDLNGDPYDGAQLFAYVPNSTTKVTLTKDQAGLSNHANPIILNARGEPADGSGVSYAMWQTGGQAVDLVLAPSDDTDPPVSAISTWEDLAGINDATLTIDQWVAGPAPTFVSTTSFTLVGDQTTDFHIGRRLKLLDSGGTDYGVITNSVFTSLTTVTVVLDSGVLDSGLSSVSYGLLTSDNHSIPTGATLNWTGDHGFAGGVNLGADVDLAGIEGKDGQLPSVNVGSSAMVWWAPARYISGLIISNGTDTDHDIDIAVGEATDSGADYVMKLTSGFTKQIDFTWAVGTDAGGLFSGSVAATTWYHVFLIRKDSDGSLDAGFDTSVTAANIPAGYTAYRRIGSVLTDGVPAIIAFTQVENEFFWSDPPLDVDTTIGTSSTSHTLSTPSDVVTKARVIALQTNDSTTYVYIRSLNNNDEAPSITAAPLYTSDSGTSGGIMNLITNTSSQIASRANKAATDLKIATLGYMDYF